MPAGPSDTGATLTAIAALLTALTGMISAGVAGVVTLRRRKVEAGTDANTSAAIAAEVARILAAQQKHEEGEL